MIDEVEFREILNSLGLVFCPFAKAILNNHCQCEYSHRHLLAGREIAGCKYEIAQAECRQVLAALRKASVFSLKIRDSGALAHGKAIRIQAGGLAGLRHALAPKETGPVANVHALIRQAQETFGSLETLPDQEIIKGIAGFRGRRRGAR